MALIQNPMVPSADVHAGIRIPIGFGKPSKLASIIEKSSGVTLSNDNEKYLDSANAKRNDLEQRVILLEKMMDSSYRTPPTIIVNNYIDKDSLGKQQVQTQVLQTMPEKTSDSKTVGPTYTQAQVDSANAEIKKMRQDVEKRMKEDGLEPPKEPKSRTKKNGNEPVEGSKADKKAKKAEQRYQYESQQYNSAVEDELSKMRKQQAITSTAIVGAISANAIVDANNNKAVNPVVIKDTVMIEKIIRDTIFIRDTIKVISSENVSVNNLQTTALTEVPTAKQVPEFSKASVFFASGSATISKNDTKTLNKAAEWMLKNPDRKILLTGVTDATGTPEVNRKLAQKRIDAVKRVFEQKGIDLSRFEEDMQTSKVKSNQPSSANRRVDIKVIK
jgi:outer membrane protein OmpA-like peptidoglycan-associated protein